MTLSQTVYSAHRSPYSSCTTEQWGWKVFKIGDARNDGMPVAACMCLHLDNSNLSISPETREIVKTQQT